MDPTPRGLFDVVDGITLKFMVLRNVMVCALQHEMAVLLNVRGVARASPRRIGAPKRTGLVYEPPRCSLVASCLCATTAAGASRRTL